MLNEIFKEAWPLIESAAPNVARILGGAPIALVTTVIPVIAKAFGLETNNIAELSSQIAADPNAHAILANLDSNHSDWIGPLLTQMNSKLDTLDFHVNLKWK